MMNDYNGTTPDSMSRRAGEYDNMERPLRAYALKIGAFVLVVFLITFLSALARASASDCEFIRNADDRHFCRAVTKKLKSECEFIRDADKRSSCRAGFSPR